MPIKVYLFHSLICLVGFSYADTTDKAIKNTKESLQLQIWEIEQDNEPIHEPTSIENTELSHNSLPLLVDVFIPSIRERINNRSVSRTITLPAWLNATALDKNVNFSKILQDTLIKGIQD